MNVETERRRRTTLNVGVSNTQGLSTCVRVIGSSNHRYSITSEGEIRFSPGTVLLRYDKLLPRIVGVSGKHIY
jgi:hypothetical protein